MRSVLAVLACTLLTLSLAAGCSSEEQQDTGSSSPRPVFKKTGKLKPIHSGYKSTQTTTAYIKKLVSDLDGTNESLRAAALDELVEIGRPAVQHLENALKHKSPMVREGACLALGRIARLPGSFMMNKLVALLDDKDVRVLRAACFAIGHIGTDDTAAAKKVYSLCSHPDPTVRSYAAECIRKLHYWPAIPALIFNHLAPRKEGEGTPDADPGLSYTRPLRAYAADALAHITHVDYGVDFSMWRKWWIYNQDRYTQDWNER